MEKKMKILCVDDEPINLLILKQLLGKHHDITTAEDGNDGLEKLGQDSEIEVVISDMNMPGLNGLEFIKEASNRFEGKKYFILTGYPITPEMEEALETKLISNYFEKPANTKLLLKAIEESN